MMREANHVSYEKIVLRPVAPHGQQSLNVASAKPNPSQSGQTLVIGSSPSHCAKTGSSSAAPPDLTGSGPSSTPVPLQPGETGTSRIVIHVDLNSHVVQLVNHDLRPAGAVSPDRFDHPQTLLRCLRRSYPNGERIYVIGCHAGSASVSSSSHRVPWQSTSTNSGCTQNPERPTTA